MEGFPWLALLKPLPSPLVAQAQWEQLGTGFSEVAIPREAKAQWHPEDLGAEATLGRPKPALWLAMQPLLHIAFSTETGAVVIHTSLFLKPAQLNQ